MSNDKDQSVIEGWFILELFGHQKVAGLVKTVPLGGDAMLRVDVPEIKYTRRVYAPGKVEDLLETIPAFTKFYSPKSVYAMTPVSEETCKAAMQSFRSTPVNTFELRQPALPVPVPSLEDDEEDDGSEFS
jgi:hypothetical protein